METLQRTANRGSVSTGYDIDNSLKFEADNSEKLSRSQTTGTNRKKFTVSFWVKRTEPGAFQVLAIAEASGNDISFLDFESDDFLRFRDTASASNQCILETNRVFRDASAWYHIVLRVDTTLSTADDRARIYVNGVQETSFSTRTNFDLNDDTFWGYNGGSLTWGNALGEANYFSGYVADAYYIDGQSLAPTSFGEVDDDTGIWKPINASGLTVGNNGYYLDFKDASNLGNDASGGTDFSLTNITSIDQATDTPTNNFCTINPLVDNAFAIFSLTEGGTRGPNTAEGNKAVGTFGVSSGKWYWEGVTTSASGTNYWQWGITRIDMQQGLSHDPGQGSAWYSAENTFLTQTGVGSSDPTYNTGITSYTVGDIWSISLNCDVSPYQMTLRFNNSVAGTSANNTDRSVGTFASADAVMPYYFLYNIASDDTWHNFGNPFIATLSGGNSDENGYGDFKYAPPTGYYALCSKNLAEFG